MEATEYNAQKRGGKGVKAMSTREEDFVETVFTASTHDNILFFTSFGRVYVQKGYRIPRAERNARGVNIVNILPLEENEKIATMIHSRGVEEDAYLVMVTKNGTVKRMQQSVLRNIRRSGIRAIHLLEGDELIAVLATGGADTVFLATRLGQIVAFPETELRPCGRAAAGVRGIRLRQGDYVIGAGASGEGEYVLTVSEYGFGRRTRQEDYGITHRGGLGRINYKVNDKTGSVADMILVNEDEDVLALSDDATLIRMPASDISICGRTARGVRIKNVTDAKGARKDEDGEEENMRVRITSIARAEKVEPEDTAEEPEGEAPAGAEAGSTDEER